MCALKQRSHEDAPAHRRWRLSFIILEKESSADEILPNLLKILSSSTLAKRTVSVFFGAVSLINVPRRTVRCRTSARSPVAVILSPPALNRPALTCVLLFGDAA